ncbi:MAG: glycosyl hydrolase, partial [Eudoraea sp.]
PDITYRTQQSSGWSNPDMRLEGENHPNGVIVNYYIKDKKETDTIALEILDAKGALVQKYNTNAKLDKQDPSATKPLKVVTGGNRFIWDLRYPGFKSFEGMVLYSSPNVGPKAVPGTYRVRLTYNGIASEKEFTIVKDPRLPNTETDFKNQFDFLIKVRDQVNRANQAIIDIRSVKKDLAYVKEKVTTDEDLNKLVEEFETKLDKVENNIHMTKNQSRQDPLNYGIRINNRLAFLMSDSQRGDYPPTDQSLAFFKEIKKELDIEIDSLNDLFEAYVNKINSQVSDKQIKMISTN